jgi:hypothetical protein
VSFSTSKNTAVVNVLLPADKVGHKFLKQPLVHLKKEKTLITIQKPLLKWWSKTNVAVATTINHPDIGALKRSIESNAK